MNNERIEVSAKTLDAALKKGLEKLGVEREAAEWEVIQEAGFLRSCKISIAKKQKQALLAKAYAEKILELMGFEYEVEQTETEDEILLELTGISAGDIIGYRGDVLDALQYMLNVLTKNFDDDYKRVTVDIENYREKRCETLTRLAKNLEKKVRRTARPVKLEFMNSFERRIIHTALQDSEFVDTTSEGEEPRRYVVVKLKRGLKPRPDGKGGRGEKKPYDKSERRDRGGRDSSHLSRPQVSENAVGDDDNVAGKAITEFDDEKKEPTYDGGTLKKLNFVYRSDKKRRRTK